MEKETCSVSKLFWEYIGKCRGVRQEHITFWGADLNKGEAVSSFSGRVEGGGGGKKGWTLILQEMVALCYC